MVTDQKHSSDNASREQEVIRHTESKAWLLGLDEQNAGAYKALSGENRALKKQLEDYHSQHSTLERRVKRLERDVKSLETELGDQDECVDRETVVDLIHEIVPVLISEKGQKKNKDFIYTSKSSEESDSVEIIDVRDKKAVSHKQRRRMRPRKVKRVVV
ncbi:hypothetical protein RhiirC2_796227 [Rhizophagus irregularis]|uniref:Uncharacterized protein n=1 Tax=Rhizophagus irregularis TaxID=588596 RepID=A0A2N1MA16_9GLOM|nr:hypothetical protein RhiirC2_796227 [Rhizophagus irregularis]